MKIATGAVRPTLQPPTMSHAATTTSPSLKIPRSWGPKAPTKPKHKPSLLSSNHNIKWMELQGIRNWEGLLDPLDDRLRDEILRYGDFVEAAYNCFDFDTSSNSYAACCRPQDSILRACSGYQVTTSLHATSGVHMPAWAAARLPCWAMAQSAWIGYVAVCTDHNEIARLGRRDVVVAYRGTGTCMEWIENLRVGLTGLPEGPAYSPLRPMVQSGFLSLYTTAEAGRPSLQDSIRDEISKILIEYGDEPLSITVTGHSLGAALATLTAHDIKRTFKNAPLVTVVSFGGPRIGNKAFRSQLDKSGTKVLRIVNSDDPVTKVPGFVLKEEQANKLRWFQKCVEETKWVYAEIGKELRLSSRECPNLNGGVATCHDLKTYLHLVDSFVSTNCPLRATARRVFRSQPIR